MRSTMTVFACALFMTVPAAIVLADEVAAPAASATPAAPVTAVPADASATAAPAASSAAASAPTAGAAAPGGGGASAATGGEPIKLGIEVPPPSEFKPPPGFRPVKKGLETVYCKSYTPVGSRLPQQDCYSKDQVEAIARQAELDRQLMHKKATNGGTNGG